MSVRYFFRIEYDGAGFAGWQRQPGRSSVQEEIERAFSIVCREKCTIVGAGRTDAGVHARAQGAHIDISSPVDTQACERSVNGVLPPTIGISCLCEVEPEFHARYSARRRRYQYFMTRSKKPLWRSRAWYLKADIDWERVRRECGDIAGEHDFTPFCSSNTSTENMTCTVFDVSVGEYENDIMVFSIEANRFVYKMVRSIVGTLVDIGRGACPHSIREILASKDRSMAGATAPAHALTLDTVLYQGVDE
jgi:tRNA pseudouridine38-40 synthase